MDKLSFRTIAIGLLSAVFFGAKSDESAEELIEKINEKAKAIHTIQYQADYRVKYFSNEDTLSLSGLCSFEKVPEDTLMGFNAIMSTDKGYEYRYRLDHLLIFDHNNQKVRIVEPQKHSVSFIQGNIVNGLILKEILKGLETDEIREGLTKARLIDTAETATHLVLELMQPDALDFSGMVKTLWINKESYLPEKMTFRANWQDMFQYNELTLSDVQVNTELDFSNDSIPETYAAEMYVPPSKDSYKPLEVGSAAPDFELPTVDGEIVTLSDYKGKVVLLDFWYMSCYPCVKALPHLQELSARYGGKGLVVMGLNSKDLNKRDKIPDFLNKRDILYPTLLSDHITDSIYRVKSYPTLYLIDKEGRVSHVQMGFGTEISEDFTHKLDSTLSH